MQACVDRQQGFQSRVTGSRAGRFVCWRGRRFITLWHVPETRSTVIPHNRHNGQDCGRSSCFPRSSRSTAIVCVCVCGIAPRSRLQRVTLCSSDRLAGVCALCFGWGCQSTPVTGAGRFIRSSCPPSVSKGGARCVLDTNAIMVIRRIVNFWDVGVNFYCKTLTSLLVLAGNGSALGALAVSWPPGREGAYPKTTSRAFAWLGFTCGVKAGESNVEGMLSTCTAPERYTPGKGSC